MKTLSWLLLLPACLAAGPKPLHDTQDLFLPRGKDEHRIPVLTVTKRGSALAFAERRIGGARDFGTDKEIVFRRSTDRGRTWSAAQELFTRPGWTGVIGNAVTDPASGAVMLIYCRMPTVAGMREKDWVEGRNLPPAVEGSGWHIARSTDDGRTWTHSMMASAPDPGLFARVTASVYRPHGGGPSLALRYGPKKGRLVVPTKTWVKPVFDLLVSYRNGVIYSDDGGHTWRQGGLAQPGTGEAAIVELADGTLLIHSRAYFRDSHRRTALSTDGGETFSRFDIDRTLVEPPGGCNASMIRVSGPHNRSRSRILFANPGDRERREHMTVRLSYDETRTWPASKVVNAGYSGYSSLAVLPDSTVLLFYEHGETNRMESLRLVRFNLAWLTDGNDTDR